MRPVSVRGRRLQCAPENVLHALPRGVPAGAVVSEDRARAEVYARSGGIDEIFGHGQATDFSHRWAKGKLGVWRPANGLHLQRQTHEWLERNRNLARLGGWHVRSGAVLQEAPVWLANPWPAWWLIDDLTTPHVLIYCDDQPVRPHLPFESNADYAAFRESQLLHIA